MFVKTALAFLAVGALSVSAWTVPVARSPAPEPESQGLEAWMFKRDLLYNLFSREFQDELFSREPEDLAEWAGFARSSSFDKSKGLPNLQEEYVNTGGKHPSGITPTNPTTKSSGLKGKRFSREFQDNLFSREPEDLAEWAGFARVFTPDPLSPVPKLDNPQDNTGGKHPSEIAPRPKPSPKKN